MGRPIAMFSFYLNYQVGGFIPLSYKLFNIVVHALNTILVFIISCRLLNLLFNRTTIVNRPNNIEYLAFWVTVFWAAHPINLTAVLYVVQRMTSMSALFTLLGMYFYIDLREKQNNKIKGMILKLSFIILLGLSAALCKENGLLLFLFIFILECFLFRWKLNTQQEKWCLKIFYVFVLVLPLFVVAVLLVSGDLTANYVGRSFDITERLLTEFRVLWFYIFQIVLPQANLFGLYHDDFVISVSLIKPLSTLLSIISFVLLFMISIRFNKKHVWFSFGLAIFFAGHLMESTILPLNLVHEHRNYFPSLGLIIVLVVFLNLIINKVKFLNSNYIFLAIAVLFTSITMNRAYDWSDSVLLGERLVQRHPGSYTTNYEMGYTYAKLYQSTRNPDFGYAAQKVLTKAASLSDQNMQAALSLVHLNAMMREEVDPVLINKIAMDLKNGRTSDFEITSIRQLVNCHIESICEVSDTIMETIFSSLLVNKVIDYKRKDTVFYLYANYLMTTPEGKNKALSIMQDLVARNPDNIQYQVKFISLLLSENMLNEANLLMKGLTRRHGIKWNVIKE